MIDFIRVHTYETELRSGVRVAWKAGEQTGTIGFSFEQDKLSARDVAGAVNRGLEELVEQLNTATEVENAEFPTVDAVPVIRCKDCKHAEILERNCELSKSCYMHCNLWRGDETRNVWHKYKKYYRDYSIVELDGYCSDGERRSGDEY